MNTQIDLHKENTVLREQILKLMNKHINPPIVMMEPKEVVEKYHDVQDKLREFKKLFWRFYWK